MQRVTRLIPHGISHLAHPSRWYSRWIGPVVHILSRASHTNAWRTPSTSPSADANTSWQHCGCIIECIVAIVVQAHCWRCCNTTFIAAAWASIAALPLLQKHKRHCGRAAITEARQSSTGHAPVRLQHGWCSWSTGDAPATGRATLHWHQQRTHRRPVRDNTVLSLDGPPHSFWHSYRRSSHDIWHSPCNIWCNTIIVAGARREHHVVASSPP